MSPGIKPGDARSWTQFSQSDNMNALTLATFAIVLTACNAGVLGLHGLGLVGSGLEGQYIPSGLERLYDDGSYRGEQHLGVGLVGGVLGHSLLVAPGSGLEGQYVPSGNELLHDDGSYRVEHHLAGHNLILH